VQRRALPPSVPAYRQRKPVVDEDSVRRSSQLRPGPRKLLVRGWLGGTAPMWPSLFMRSRLVVHAVRRLACHRPGFVVDRVRRAARHRGRSGDGGGSRGGHRRIGRKQLAVHVFRLLSAEPERHRCQDRGRGTCGGRGRIRRYGQRAPRSPSASFFCDNERSECGVAPRTQGAASARKRDGDRRERRRPGAPAGSVEVFALRHVGCSDSGRPTGAPCARP